LSDGVRRRRHHDGDGSGRFLRSERGPIPCGHDQVNLETNQLRCELRQAPWFILSKAVLDSKILSLDPAKFPQLLAERLQQSCDTRSVAWVEEADAKDFPCLLRVNGTAERKEQGAKSNDRDFFLHVSVCSIHLSIDI